MKLKLLLLSLAGALLSACQAAPAIKQVPALMINSNDKALDEIQQTAAKMLGIPSIALAKSAFTVSSEVQIARTPRYDASGQLVQGRVMENPTTLTLLVSDKRCWLAYQDQLILLKQVECVAQ